MHCGAGGGAGSGGCLSGVGTYLWGTVKQAVLVVSECTSHALWGRVAACLSVV